jgi:hypothetical protein
MFKNAAEAAILHSTGYVVCLEQKRHFQLWDLIKEGAAASEPTHRDPVYDLPGNCIPAAIAQCMAESSGVRDELLKKTRKHNKTALATNARTYRDCMAQFGCVLHPGTYILNHWILMLINMKTISIDLCTY